MRAIKSATPGMRRRKARRKVRQREKKHMRRKGMRRWRSARPKFRGEFVRLVAPEIICMTHFARRTATLAFCRRIREAYLRNGENLLLDFSRTKKLRSQGMLIVVAEIDRAQRMGLASQAIRCRLPTADEEEGRIVQQVFAQIGLLERLKHPSIDSDAAEFHSSVRNWRYATGTRIDDRPSDVLYAHEGQLAPALIKKMNIGLAEAVTNSLHHAYAKPRADGCRTFNERRWWMFTAESEDMLHVLVCDLGIGIARSLTGAGKWDKSLLKKLDAAFSADCPDVRAIKTALIVGESATEEDHRGKGLPQIWNAVHESGVGGVAIMSGHGHLARDMDADWPSDGYYKSEMLGTLITWQVPVGAAGSESDG